MKKLLTALAALAIMAVCFVLLPTEAHAAEIASGACGDNLTWSLDSASGILTIDGSGDMQSFLNNAPWLVYKPYIKEIVIAEGVTSISSRAFEELTALKAVTIPSSITNIKIHAFFGCTALERVYISNTANWCKINFASYTANPVYYSGNLYLNGEPLVDLVIPSGITSVGYALFANCDTLQSVKIPDGVTSIGEGAFDGCSNLTSITIPKTITAIGEYAFSHCSALTSMTLPNGITIIERYAFSGCDNLKSINIPNGVTTIGEKAFYYCENMTSVMLPVSLRLIESDAFYYTQLQHVLYKGSQAQWSEITIAKYNTALNDAGIIYNAADGLLGEHTYGNWTILDNDGHECICTLCGHKMTKSHRWDSGSITKQPTCKETGIKTYTCYICAGTKTASVSKLTTHTYDNACDTVCNICNNTRTVSHQYSSSWSNDISGHWKACTLCGNKADQATHTPGAAATEHTAQTCAKCNYVIQAPLGHTHSFDTNWSKDVSGHWHACICGGQIDYAAHSYTNSCDTDCDACGHTRTITHTPGEAATTTTDQICTVCGRVLNKATGETEPTTPPTEPSTPPTETPTEPVTEPTTNPTGGTDPTVAPSTPNSTTPPSETSTEDKTANTAVIVIIAVIGGVILGCGGAAAGIILLKKKQ